MTDVEERGAFMVLPDDINRAMDGETVAITTADTDRVLVLQSVVIGDGD